ncbi:hypothetical protein [Legionella jamestowniensis]|nr:hypothetical protein [Legionella jamestowniensis]KTD08176.1 hypothetical protein Ljam_2371 [Legionella jamestowniensis]SFL98912.1 hypothetical protein SAMN02746073_2925 [Legionella jamestowniensis DSM 19215]
MASLKDIKNGLFPNKEQQVPVDPFVKVMAEREAKETEQKNIERTRDIKERKSSAAHDRQYSKEVMEAKKIVEDNIKKMISGRSEAYVEWATGMNMIVGYLRDFVDYIYKSMDYEATPNISWDKSNSDNLNIKGDGKALPDISYSVTMDDTGHIKTAVKADKNIITAEEKKYFDVALAAWAKEKGYTLEADHANLDAGFTLRDDKTKELVTDKAVFDNLKKDSTNGLHSYLTDRFAMALEELNTPVVDRP